jgi:hypothetical protein
MKKVGMRRGLRALVLVGAIVCLLTTGLATQATATFKQANPNSSISQTQTPVPAGYTLLVAVSTGTFSGEVGCHDSVGNTYTVVADQNSGSGRLFVCSSVLTTTIEPDDEITATYPAFSGLSVMSVTILTGAPLTADTHHSASGSNTAVSSGTINVGGFYVLVGVVANSNISTFVQDPGWTTPYAVSGGSGAGKRTISIVAQVVFGPPTDYAVTGHLTGSGFWQAAIIGYPVVI